MADLDMSLDFDSTNVDVEGTGPKTDAPYTVEVDGRNGKFIFDPTQRLPQRLHNLLATPDQVEALADDARMGYDVTEQLLASGRRGMSRLGQIWHIARIVDGKEVPRKVQTSWLGGKSRNGREMTRYAVVYRPGEEGIDTDPVAAMESGRISFRKMEDVAKQSRRRKEPLFDLHEHYFRNYVLHLHADDDNPDQFIIAMQCRVTFTERGTKAGDPQLRTIVHSGDGFRDAIVTNTGFGKWDAREKALLGFMGRLDYQRQVQPVVETFRADMYCTAWVTVMNGYLGHSFEQQEGSEVAPTFHAFLKSVDDPSGRWTASAGRSLPESYLWKGAALNVAG